MLRCYKNCGQTSSSYIYKVEERLIEILSDRLQDLKVKYSDSTGENELKNELTLLEKSLDKSHAQEKKLRDQQARQYDFLEQGVYSVDVFLERNQAVADALDQEHEKQSNLQNQIADMEERINNVSLLLPDVTSSLDFLENVYPERRTNF